MWPCAFSVSDPEDREDREDQGDRGRGGRDGREGGGEGGEELRELRDADARKAGEMTRSAVDVDSSARLPGGVGTHATLSDV